MNKKVFLTLLAMLLAVSFVAGCGSSETAPEASASPAQTASDLDYITEKGTMQIGITLFSPMNYYEGDTLVGFETEFATAVCEKLGVTPEFVEINWDSKEIELNAKNIDCIWNGMTITDERKQNMGISTPYMENRQVMIVKSENADQYTESVDGAVVVAEKGSTGEELAMENEFFANAVYNAVDSQATGLMDVAAGTSDVVIGDYVMAAGSIGEGTDYKDLVMIDKKFTADEYGIAFRKGSDMVEKVNEIIAELAADGTLKEIADKYHLGDLLLVK